MASLVANLKLDAAAFRSGVSDAAASLKSMQGALDASASVARAFDTALATTGEKLAALRESPAEVLLRARDEASAVVTSVEEKAKALQTSAGDLTLRAKDEASSVLSIVESRAKALASGPLNLAITAKDQASAILSTVETKATAIAHLVIDPVIKVKDTASQVIASVQTKANALLHLVIDPAIKAKDEATAVLSKVQSKATSLMHLVIDPVIKVKDEATAVISKVTSALDKLKSLTVDPVIKVKDQASSALGSLKQKITGVGDEGKKSGGRLSGALGSIGSAAASQISPLTAMGTAAAGAFALDKVVQAGSEWQTTLQNVQGNTTLTSAQMHQMDQTIRGMAANSSVSMDQLATGFMHVTNLGYSMADSQKIVDAAMKSAVSTGSDAGVTTNVLASAMKEFNLPANDAAKAMDTLHLAAATGNMTLEDLVTSGGRAISTAANLGDTLPDVSAAFTALSQHGFDASQAATQITGILTHLLNPAKAAGDEIARLSKTTGVDLVGDFSQAGLKAKGLTGIMADIQKATSGDSSEILKLIPALRGGQGALALTGTGANDLQNAFKLLSGVTNASGVSAQAYAEKQKTLGAQMGEFENKIHLGAIALSGALMPALASAVGGINSIVSAVQAWIAAHGPLIAQLKGDLSAALHDLASIISGTILPALRDLASLVAGELTAAWSNLKGPIADLKGPLSDLMSAFESLGKTLADHKVILAAVAVAFGLVLSPVTVLGAALIEAAAHWDAITQAVSRVLGPTTEIGRVLESLVHSTLAALAPVLDNLKQLWSELSSQFSASTPLVQALEQAWSALKGPLEVIAAIIGGTLIVAIGLVLGALSGLVGFLAGALPGAIQAVTGIIQTFTGVIQIISSVVVGVVKIVNDLIHGDWSQAWQDAQTMVSGVVTGIESLVTGLKNIVVGLFEGLVSGVVGAVSGFVKTVVGFFQNLYDELVGHSIVPDMLNAIVNLFTGLPGRIVGALGSLVSLVVGKFTDMMTSGITAIETGISTVVSDFAALPGKIVSALGDLGGLLVGAGEKLIGGLISGVEGKLKDLKGELGKVTGLIPSWKGPPSVDQTLLTPAGQDIMQSLIDGLESQFGPLKTSLSSAGTLIVKGAASWLPDLQSFLVSQFPDLSATATKAGNVVIDGISGGVTSGTAKAKKVVVEAGQSLLDGITSGIQSLFPELQASVDGANLILSGLGTDALQQVLSFFQLNLPKFAASVDQYGNIVVAGVAASATTAASALSKLDGQIKTDTSDTDAAATAMAKLGDQLDRLMSGSPNDKPQGPVTAGMLGDLKQQVLDAQNTATQLQSIAQGLWQQVVADATAGNTQLEALDKQRAQFATTQADDAYKQWSTLQQQQVTDTKTYNDAIAKAQTDLATNQLNLTKLINDQTKADYLGVTQAKLTSDQQYASQSEALLVGLYAKKQTLLQQYQSDLLQGDQAAALADQQQLADLTNQLTQQAGLYQSYTSTVTADQSALTQQQKTASAIDLSDFLDTNQRKIAADKTLTDSQKSSLQDLITADRAKSDADVQMFETLSVRAAQWTSYLQAAMAAGDAAGVAMAQNVLTQIGTMTAGVENDAKGIQAAFTTAFGSATSAAEQFGQAASAAGSAAAGAIASASAASQQDLGGLILQIGTIGRLMTEYGLTNAQAQSLLSGQYLGSSPLNASQAVTFPGQLNPAVPGDLGLSVNQGNGPSPVVVNNIIDGQTVSTITSNLQFNQQVVDVPVP